MAYTELKDMLGDKNHHRFEQVSWKQEPCYIQEDNTIYKLHSFYGHGSKTWLDDQSSLFKENDYRVYIPVATLETVGGKPIYIGYIWERANMANYLLDLDTTREVYYPNLIWCDVGNHPYPKFIRTGESWYEMNYNKEVTKLVYPHYDIAKAVRFPSLLGLSPKPQ